MYFVSHGGEAFPSLIIVLQGDGVRVDLTGTTFISKAGITSTTFKTVPDVPVNSFELYLPEGRYSALAANGNLCKLQGKLKMPTPFVAQNGAGVQTDDEDHGHAAAREQRKQKPKNKNETKQKKRAAKATGGQRAMKPTTRSITSLPATNPRCHEHSAPQRYLPLKQRRSVKEILSEPSGLGKWTRDGRKDLHPRAKKNAARLSPAAKAGWL